MRSPVDKSPLELYIFFLIDLTSRPGFWAKAFSDHLVKKDAILNFHVNSGGEIHFSIDGEDKGIFLSGIDTRLPLWAVMDIYGNTTAVELVGE